IMLLPMEAVEIQLASLQIMPQELLLAIGQTLTPNEKLHLVLATYRMRLEEIDPFALSRPQDGWYSYFATTKVMSQVNEELNSSERIRNINSAAVHGEEAEPKSEKG
ncbi:MAG: hypothetical protein Q9180_004108, partial [Flavoplaca navasiana]